MHEHDFDERVEPDEDYRRELDALATPASTHAPDSLRAMAQGMRVAARDEVTTELDLPGYSGRFVARFRLLGTDDLGKHEQATEKQRKKIGKRAYLYGKCATIADACTEILGYRGDELVRVSDGFDDAAARFFANDGEDVSHLQTPGSRVRFVVPREVAVGMLYAELMTWMAEGNQGADDDAMGESTATGS